MGNKRNSDERQQVVLGRSETDRTSQLSGPGGTGLRIFIDRLESNYRELIERGLEITGFFEGVRPKAKVFLKPNLTFPVYRPGVMTSFECLEAATEVLVGRGYEVMIGEADSGGYNRFSMDEVFEKIGINRLAERTGAKVVNISFTAAEVVELKVGMRTLRIPIPKLLLEEVDAFISLPVPKIHMNTLVSMSIKNEWGCIQDPAERLKLHPYFAEVIYEVCRRLPQPYAIMDGRYGLNGSGPMRGDPVELNWLMVSNDLVSADRLGCRLMGIEEGRVGHLRYFQRKGWWSDLESVSINQPWERFIKERFYLKRAWTDWPGFLCFKSSTLAWLGYRSPLAGLLHWGLYLFRKPFYDYEGERQRVRKPGGRAGEGSGAIGERVNVLGVGISVLNLEKAVGAMVKAIRERRKGYICVTGVHGVSEAQKDSRFRGILNRAFLCTPDGMPMVWMGRLNGRKEMGRVYGPDLMLEVCKWSQKNSCRHFLFGGAEGVAEGLKTRLEARFPGIQIVGWFTPPFRSLNDEERGELKRRIAELKPDIMWVGLSTPKQEKFMDEFLEELDVTLMVGVGAAFDFHAGRVKQAPVWMQKSGLEWFYRLWQEPRRLWRRYLKNNPLFIARVIGQMSGLRKYQLDD